MKVPTVTTLKKYLAAMTKMKKKYITADSLSRVLGVYPEIINENLSFFDPMINMDYEYNLLDLVPQIKNYITEKEENKKPTPSRELVTKKVVHEYNSIGDFLYQKMTIGGLLDKNIVLSDKDLRILKKLITEEQNSRKKK